MAREVFFDLVVGDALGVHGHGQYFDQIIGVFGLPVTSVQGMESMKDSCTNDYSG